MATFAAHILAVFAILILGWVMFFAWVAMVIVKGIWMGFSKMTGMGRGDASRIRPRLCTRLRCRAANPSHANYCARCGSLLTRPVVQRQTSASVIAARWASRGGHA